MSIVLVHFITFKVLFAFPERNSLLLLTPNFIQVWSISDGSGCLRAPDYRISFKNILQHIDPTSKMGRFIPNKFLLFEHKTS